MNKWGVYRNGKLMTWTRTRAWARRICGHDECVVRIR